LFFSCGEKIDETAILGDWEAIKGNYQQINFSKDNNERIFSAYLYGRLFDDGLWEIKGNNITVKFNSGEIEEFKNISFENGILIINGVEQKYQRPKTKGEKLDEMIKKFFAIEGLSFSDPIDAEFNWNDENGEQTLIKRKMIKTELILSTDDYTDLSNLEN
jgi:hypothetical protein